MGGYWAPVPLPSLAGFSLNVCPSPGYVPTPFDETCGLYWIVFLLAFAVGIFYVLLLLRALMKGRAREPYAASFDLETEERSPPPKE